MEEKFLQLIDDYKKFVASTGNVKEIYKWEAIVHFQEHWDFDALDFHKMFKEAFKKRDNLMFQNSFGFLNKLGKAYPDKLKKLFLVLLNKNSSFEAIYNAARQLGDAYLEDLKAKLKRDNLSHQLDERAISFILTMNNPEKFYLYKSNVYEAFCDYLNIDKKRSAGEKYKHFEEIGDGLLHLIENDKELLQACDAYIPDDVDFNSNKLILQDIVYNLLIINAIDKDNMNIVKQNVKKEFIKWYIANPRSSYFNNDPDKLSEYLTKSSDSFSKDIFLVNSATYKEMIAFIKDAINNNKPKFLKNHGASDSGKLAAIVGKRNYLKFLIEKFEGAKKKNNVRSYYKASLNQIFYGPPGTGKTYNSILEAAKIIEQDNALVYSDALDIFNSELKNRIEFITFHQNYSYEDFIQGLRPDIEQKALSFNRADGVFAKIATNALFEYYKIFQKKQIKNTNNTDIKIDLNDAFIEFMNSLKEGQEFESKTGRIIKVDSFTDRQNIEFKPANGVKSYLVSGDRLLKLYKEFEDIDKIKRVHDDIRGAIGGCNSTIYYVALREFIEFLKEYNKDVEEFSDTDEEYNYEDITYRRKKELLSNFSIEDITSVSEKEVPNYVIIIDEINRANISRVFGELITLIEKDKRSHGKIPIKATLPSGEQFIVPSNLSIIGTMNTADKSIALLDIALRRRFEFKAMYPKYSIGDRTIHKAGFLEKLNNLIVASGKGHDFTIGHSYFMDDDDNFNFIDVVNNKVIPLLLEYYMNDEKEVTDILNKALVEEQCSIANWPLEIVINDN